VDEINVQWFPIYQSGEAPFLLGKDPSGLIGASAKMTIVVDNFPHQLYGVRFDVTYELPPAIFGQVLDYRRNMRDGGVDDDFDVTIKLSQQSVVGEAAHVRNVRGALGVNQHPWPVPYPLRGANNIAIEARRNSSYAEIRIGETITTVAPILKVTLELARGVRSEADNVTGPGSPGSTGYRR